MVVPTNNVFDTGFESLEPEQDNAALRAYAEQLEAYTRVQWVEAKRQQVAAGFTNPGQGGKRNSVGDGPAVIPMDTDSFGAVRQA